MDGGVWGMAAGALLLLYGLCRLYPEGNGRRQRRARLCLLCGGCLFVLGVLFVCCPQRWGSAILWGWGGVSAFLLCAHEWLSPD